MLPLLTINIRIILVDVIHTDDLGSTDDDVDVDDGDDDDDNDDDDEDDDDDVI